MASQKREEAPLFLAMGLNYVELAQKERNLFLFLCRSDDSPATDIRQLLGYGDVSSAVKDVPGMEGLAREQVEELFIMVWIFTHGLANMAANGRLRLSGDEIKGLLVKAYLAFAASVKGKKA